MFTPLPNLDDRRWQDLVSEGIALLPVHAPEWTDFNAHDPGITLLELFAYVTEGLLYRTNRIPMARKARMLDLLGIRRRPARAARFTVTFGLAPDAGPVTLPTTTELAAGTIPSRTLRPLTVTGAVIRGLSRVANEGDTNLMSALSRGDSVTAFPARPAAGDALEIEIASRARPGDRITLHVRLAGARSGRSGRRHALDEALRRRRARRPRQDPCGSGRPPAPRCCRRDDTVLVWEWRGGDGTWSPATVFDGTRGLTQDGPVVLTAPPSADAQADRVDRLRLRVAAGEWDSPRIVQAILPDTAEAEQSVPVWYSFAIARGATVTGTPPQPGQRSRIGMTLDEVGRITSLSFGGDSGPAVALLAFRPPGADPGVLSVDLVPVVRGSGAPWQSAELAQSPGTFLDPLLHSREHDAWHGWHLRDDLFASRAADWDLARHEDGQRIGFGDGAAGRSPPANAWLCGQWRSTLGAGGTLADGTPIALAATPRNAALLDVADATKRLTSPVVAYTIEPGSARETIAAAIARAAAGREATERAITLADFERLARATPGTDIARVIAMADVHPSLTGIPAPGYIAVVVIPNQGVARPFPSATLLRKVARHLEVRRILGTRLRVVGPRYREVSIMATVKSQRQASRDQVAARIATALDVFLDPLRGGPDGMGWQLGRDVYRSEILALIDRIQGVDYVVSLELAADGCAPGCGDLCLGPLTLPTPAPHAIEVTP